MCATKPARGKDKDRRQCAGHMLMVKGQNTFYRMGKMFAQDEFKLSGEELVFSSKEEAIEHHEKGN